MPVPNGVGLGLALTAVLASLFAWRSRSVTADWAAFDGARAFEDLQQVVGFAPRPPGSAALAATRQHISRELSDNGVQVWQDEVTASTPARDVPMANIVGVISDQTRSVVMIAGHYDTARLEGIRFVVANDGGSMPRWLIYP